ncbi:MAG: cation-transporting P-type ATPase [Chloroflexi bacterium]|nr:cation-transporting P-type ATPase [Chloroflexota bacterium]
MPSLDLHSLRSSEVYGALGTSPEGLSPEETQERLALYGPNRLTEPAKAQPWKRWVGDIIHPMALLLWVAGAIAFAVGHVELGIVIWIVVLVNGAFSFWREYRAEKAIATLNGLLPVYARLMRQGQEVQVPAAEIVPGDVLILAQGDNIPADARLVEAFGLRINNSVLTGEAMAVRKVDDASLQENITDLERPNLVFAGTSVVSGTGRAVVFATGMLTQFGRIANLTQAVKEPPSLLQQNMQRVARIIALFGIGLGVLVFLVGSMQIGLQQGEAFILAIGIVVAVVPEGLAPTVTLTLAMAIQRLAQDGVLVKKLSKVETLGNISVICTDKSGTLTQNQMTVREVWTGGKKWTISGVGYNPEGDFHLSNSSRGRLASTKGLTDVDLSALLSTALLCNNARLNPPSPENPQWTCLGDQTEAALRVMAVKGGVDEATLARQYPRLHELPFDARRKCMSTIHYRENGEMAFVKGAPREVLQLCTHIQVGGETRPLDPETRVEILAANDQYARRALRVLALARRELPPRSGAYTTEKVEQNLTFLGLAAMMDPPRQEVAQAMKSFRSAGIRMVMITGDYGLTAESFARRVGMLNGSTARIVTGADLDQMDDSELKRVLEGEVIFARMAPEHKLRLVDTFQSSGEVVAVIGDGVNDAPALRKADVGIAMGRSGTDVAREAADVVLIKDNFGSVVTAVEEGRAVYANLRKFMTYIFASNVPEIIPFILTALLQIPLALTVTQILAIDLGTDLLPALALGMEKPEPDILLQPPRRKSQPLVDGKLISRAFFWLGGIETVLCYLGFFAVYNTVGGPFEHSLSFLGGSLTREAFTYPAMQTYLLATTVFHTGVVMAQIGNAFACRTEKGRVTRLGWFSNPFLLFGILVEVLVMAAMVYIPPFARIFNHVPLPIGAWVSLLFFAPILFSLEKVRKIAARLAGTLLQKKQQGASI